MSAPSPVKDSVSSNFVDDRTYDEFSQRLAHTILPHLNVEKLRAVEIPEKRMKQLRDEPLTRLAQRAEQIFKSASKEVLSSPEFLEFIANGFLEVIKNIEAEADLLPPNVIADCGVNEAAFTHARDRKPIVATDALATCIGIAGYDSTNEWGFLIHFTTEDELAASMQMLNHEIYKRMKNPLIAPIQIHLRGGIKGLSEPLLAELEKWVASLNEDGCLMQIVSKQVLTEGLLDKDGRPNMMSLSLDTRDGTVSEYDSNKNPFVKKPIGQNAQDVDAIISDVLMNAVIRNPGIKIVYSS
jgi:hypothetical protein